MATNLKNHLVEAHTAMATHHTACGKCHKAMMESCEDGTPQRNFHKGMVDAHADAATYHIGAITSASGLPDVATESNRGGGGDISTGTNFDAKVATTARMADDLARRFNEAEPTRAMGVMPSDVPDLRLINRTGAAPLNTGDPSLDLDEQLRKITPRSVTA